jgi:hypothetical protein
MQWRETLSWKRFPDKPHIYDIWRLKRDPTFLVKICCVYSDNSVSIRRLGQSGKFDINEKDFLDLYERETRGPIWKPRHQ